MKHLKPLSLFAGCLLLAWSLQIRAAAIDTLTIEQVGLQLNLGVLTPNLTQPVSATITMGVFQDLPGGIVSLAGPAGMSALTVYTTGDFGAALPSGTVNEPAPGNISVDLGSLRANVTVPILGTLDFSLWPVTQPPTGGTYDSATGAFSLSWVADIIHNATKRGTFSIALSGTATVVPVPPAFWLFGSGLLGIIAVARRSRR